MLDTGVGTPKKSEGESTSDRQASRYIAVARQIEWQRDCIIVTMYMASWPDRLLRQKSHTIKNHDAKYSRKFMIWKHGL